MCTNQCLDEFDVDVTRDIQEIDLYDLLKDLEAGTTDLAKVRAAVAILVRRDLDRVGMFDRVHQL